MEANKSQITMKKENTDPGKDLNQMTFLFSENKYYTDRRIYLANQCDDIHTDRSETSGQKSHGMTKPIWIAERLCDLQN